MQSIRRKSMIVFRLVADERAVPLVHLAKAETATFLQDVMAHFTAKHAQQAVSLWDDMREQPVAVSRRS